MPPQELGLNGLGRCDARNNVINRLLRLKGKPSTVTGKLFRAQEHANLTVSHDLVREIGGIDFDRLQAKTVAKFITALMKYAGTEKTMTFASKTAFERFIREHA